MVSATGLEVSGGTTGRQRVAGVGGRLWRHTEHRKQEAGVVEAGGCAVVRVPLTLTITGYTPGSLDAQRRQLRRSAAGRRQGERNVLSAKQFRRDGW